MVWCTRRAAAAPGTQTDRRRAPSAPGMLAGRGSHGRKGGAARGRERNLWHQMAAFHATAASPGCHCCRLASPRSVLGRVRCRLWAAPPACLLIARPLPPLQSSNVLLTASGAAKLGDVGLCKRQDRTYLSDVAAIGAFDWRVGLPDPGCSWHCSAARQCRLWKAGMCSLPHCAPGCALGWPCLAG